MIPKLCFGGLSVRRDPKASVDLCPHNPDGIMRGVLRVATFTSHFFLLWGIVWSLHATHE